MATQAKQPKEQPTPTLTSGISNLGQGQTTERSEEEVSGFSGIRMELGLSTQYMVRLPVFLKLNIFFCPIHINLFGSCVSFLTEEIMRIWQLAYAVQRRNGMMVHCSTKLHPRREKEVVAHLQPGLTMRSSSSGSPTASERWASRVPARPGSWPPLPDSESPEMKTRIAELHERINLSHVDIRCNLPAIHATLLDPHSVNSQPDPDHAILSFAVPSQEICLRTRSSKSARDEKELRANVFGVEIKFHQSLQKLVCFMPWMLTRSKDKVTQWKQSLADLQARVCFEDLLAFDNPLAYPSPCE